MGSPSQAFGGLVALAAVVGACQPDLREGHYACKGDDECPSGWFCRGDQRCWSSASDLRPDTGLRDTGFLLDRGVAADAQLADGADPDLGPTDLGPRPDQGSTDAEPTDLGPDAGDSGCSANVGQTCTRTGFCDATYNCEGVCDGGTPLPTCQCGTPTCGGCVGGTCGLSSTCQNGTCVCNSGADACNCDGRGSVECDYCAPDNSIYGCETDQYGCGQTFTLYEVCAPFTCDPVDDFCFCDPDEGFSCDLIDACFCGVDVCPLPGVIECNGTCTPVTDCFNVCDSGFCTF
jgi:hypothetical protein